MRLGQPNCCFWSRVTWLVPIPSLSIEFWLVTSRLSRLMEVIAHLFVPFVGGKPGRRRFPAVRPVGLGLVPSGYRPTPEFQRGSA